MAGGQLAARGEPPRAGGLMSPRAGTGRWVACLLLALCAAVAGATDDPPTETIETVRLMLSGPGPSDAVPWRFRCTMGRGCGTWTTIPVPSNWELQGFGRYDYGYRDDKQPESADYALDFEVPSSWRGRAVELVFEGVMTDADVTLNGRRVGGHQGGFTRFSFTVGEMLRFGETNRLEVRVDEASANASVNRAERDADYWVFGGIYRPVYLEASPPVHIGHIGLDARHDGHLRVDVEVAGSGSGTDARDLTVRARVRHVDATGRGGVRSPPIDVALAPRPRVRTGELARIEASVEGIVPWSAEHPALYDLEVDLLDGDEVVHRVGRRFGFRTLQVHASGLFVNGHRVLLKGVNRHAFWPSTGRALDPRQSWDDVALIRRMNGNAIRTAHYPPDPALLDACDTLGVYVIDELSGWKDAYDTEVGRRLVREMVRRDAHHPSIILWANGNEGGWNEALDAHFHLHDPQRRPVIHPDAVFGGFDTVHYPSWNELRARAHGRRGWLSILSGSDGGVTLPTEMLHALYDGGGGAGLAAYWSLLRASPRAAGGFLWALFDEGVVRVDEGDRIDTAGADAPDGVVDPWRRPEPSFSAIRRAWSPVTMRERQLYLRVDKKAPVGRFWIANRFDQINLAACRFDYRWLRYPLPGATTGLETVASGSVAGPDVAPGRGGMLEIPWSPTPIDMLELAVYDPRGNRVETFSLINYQRSYWLRSLPDAMLSAGAPRAVTHDETDEHVVLRAGETVATIDRANGRLAGFARGATRSPVVDGPWPVGARDGRIVSYRVLEQSDGGVTFEARRSGSLKRIRWHLDPRGWLRFSYLLEDRFAEPFVGVAFGRRGRPIEADVEMATWLGREQPVWANRAAGGPIDRWRRKVTSPIGYLQDVYWVRLEGATGMLDVAIEDDYVFVGLGTPRFPDDARTARAAVPDAPFSIMHRIGGIGTKFHPASALEGVRAADPGLENAAIWMRIP